MPLDIHYKRVLKTFLTGQMKLLLERVQNTDLSKVTASVVIIYLSNNKSADKGNYLNE